MAAKSFVSTVFRTCSLKCHFYCVSSCLLEVILDSQPYEAIVRHVRAKFGKPWAVWCGESVKAAICVVLRRHASRCLSCFLNKRRRFEPFSFGNLLVWSGFERKPLDNRHSWVKCLYGLDIRKLPASPVPGPGRSG
jgi:hypothetical protein